MTGTRARIAAGVTAAVVTALGLSACSGGGASGSNASSKSAGGTASVRGAAPGSAAVTADSASAGKGGGGRTTTALARAALQGDIVYTADVSVAAADVAAAVQQTREIVEGAGGYVLDSTSSGGGAPRADVTFKIPPGAFQKVLDDIQAGVKTVTSVRQQADDVTDQVVDLKTRLSVQQASVDRVQRYLEQAKTLTEMVQLEAELTRREADLESLEGQAAALKGRVDLATLTVHVSKASATAVAHASPAGFVGGLRSGWHAFAAAATAALVVLGALLPFAALAAVAGAGWLVVRRRLTAHRVSPTP